MVPTAGLKQSEPIDEILLRADILQVGFPTRPSAAMVCDGSNRKSPIPAPSVRLLGTTRTRLFEGTKR